METAIGLIDCLNAEHALETCKAATQYNTKKIKFTATISHAELEADENLDVSTNNEFNIFVKFRLVDVDTGPRSRFLLADNLSNVMLDNSFVDIGGSSVLLEFQDGEQLCHAFPLAAREMDS
jgi:hypothetical protein